MRDTVPANASSGPGAEIVNHYCRRSRHPLASGAVLSTLRKPGEAHIRMRVINAFEPVAQSVEHVTFNHGVQGSNPCGLTIICRMSNYSRVARQSFCTNGRQR